MKFIPSFWRGLLCFSKEEGLMFVDRVLSGMRPTGALHLGHYQGVLKNWLDLQNEYECYFFVADWHALTTHYETPSILEDNVWDMLIDWLAAGVDPSQAVLFIQSKVPEHAAAISKKPTQNLP